MKVLGFFMVISMIFGCSTLSPSRELKERLVRTRNHWGYYEITVTPLTRALLDASAREQREIPRSLAQTTKTCFQLELSSVVIGVASFKDYRVTFEDHKGSALALEVESSPPRRILGDGFYRFKSFAAGCTANSVDLSKGFKVVFTPTSSLGLPESVLAWDAQATNLPLSPYTPRF